MKRNRNVVPIGALSEGSLLPDDVGGAIAWELDRIRLSKEDRKLVREWFRETGKNEPDPDTLQDLCSELGEAISNYLPPYTYYGSAEGDGACFGVWPVLDADADGFLPTYEAGESPNGSGDCYEVNDHGNVSCGRRLKNGRWIEYWSVA